MQTPRSLRKALAAAFAVTALAALPAPAAHSTPRDDDTIETGKSYYLVAPNAGNRGVTFEVSTDNDWALLTNDENSNGTAVVFEKKGEDRYTVRSTSSNWPGYDTWCSTDKGIRLAKASSCATAWKIVPDDTGFKLQEPNGRIICNPKSPKYWLKPASEVYSSEFTSFKAVELA
ncbi:hypothetical protein [Kitasatospora sp. NPDC093806]|uniref:hypothetical protein n=1 Tax=Kitasatospora sp. NPDC093806 TaxID=3155075 RepID=UPI0034202C17